MPTIERHYGAYLITGRGYGRDGQLVQTDWDYPATAQSLGWNMRRVQPAKSKDGTPRYLNRAPNRGTGCDHNGTDGTVTCPDCGLTASSFIYGAQQFLDSLS